MTDEETKRFQELCVRVISDTDKSKYEELVRELDEIMAAKEAPVRKQTSTPGVAKLWA
jgi:hypothetical protein